MSDKQAVLLIHGIGEQRPMDTLRSFVAAVWTDDSALQHKYARAGIWSKPDNLSRSFELRRLTTPQNAAGIKTDFFEFYWAHLMQGTTYGHLSAWARTLLLRRPATVPARLRAVYWLLIVLLTLALGLALYAAAAFGADATPLPPGGLLLVPLAGFIVLRILGDAARYLHVAPANIQSRQQIRQAGVEFLRALHDPARGYRRLIVVGHSLGSVIGYDILNHAWVDFHQQHRAGQGAMDALDALECLAGLPDPPIDAVQAAQRRYFEELRSNGCGWLVTDFVTLGSPLTHAAVLLARDADDLLRKQADREFPRCLPVLETAQREKQRVQRFSYELERRTKNSYRLPHHAAVFAPTRWSNLFFTVRAILWGDLIGGPLLDVMGNGVRDIPVTTHKRFGLLSHTLYWSRSASDPRATHLAALREALDLADRRGRQSAP